MAACCRDRGAGKDCPGGMGTAWGGTGGVPWGNWGCVVVPAMQGAAGLGLPCAEQTQQGEGELAQELFSSFACVLMRSNPELSGVPMAVALILGVLLLWVPSCSLLR